MLFNLKANIVMKADVFLLNHCVTQLFEELSKIKKLHLLEVNLVIFLNWNWQILMKIPQIYRLEF